MPLELGIFMGAKRYGDDRQELKRLLIFDTQKFRYQRFISDLAGMDIHAHGGKTTLVVTTTRDWLANVSRRQLPGGQRVLGLFKKFSRALPHLAKALDLDPDEIPYADFERILEGWLLNADNQAA
jgi:hypothetical protein